MIINPKNRFILFTLLGLCVCVACSKKKNKFYKNATSTAFGDAIFSKCIEPDIAKLVVKVDTVGNQPSQIRGFDVRGRIVYVVETNSLYQNNTNYWHTDEKIYDTLGRVFYESYSKGEFPMSHLECYNYTYDSKGFLIGKEGYEAAETNSYIAIQYKNGKEITRVKSKLESMPVR